MSSTQCVDAIDGMDRRTFEADIRMAGRPVILKGLASQWPAVQAARTSPEALGAYLLSFDTGAPVQVSVCPKALQGRLFYNNDLTGVNYQNVSRSLRAVVEDCLSGQDDAIYVQAQPVQNVLPAMAGDLDMPLLPRDAPPRIWIGNTLRTQTHFDYTSNIAVHVAGEKTFTLFPPDQTANLYPGPLDRMPAGVPISMASLEEPDFVRYPRLKTALDHALVAHLEPGDALFIPPLWWHHVQTTGPLNMLINYWWNDARPDLVDAMGALHVAALAFKAMPAAQRDAWRHMMDYFVFESAGDPVAHLPEHVRSAFSPGLSPQEMAQFKHLLFGPPKRS
ncbi:cupin-like domain-containing protein [Asticcacaulis solisilvae]|uniref:cupin-like domain-containing protein n=1 Tax=Asticcacaulis solisilvae TaxID=1217274 RepID=UPI003FD787A7